MGFNSLFGSSGGSQPVQAQPQQPQVPTQNQQQAPQNQSTLAKLFDYGKRWSGYQDIKDYNAGKFSFASALGRQLGRQMQPLQIPQQALYGIAQDNITARKKAQEKPGGLAKFMLKDILFGPVGQVARGIKGAGRALDNPNLSLKGLMEQSIGRTMTDKERALTIPVRAAASVLTDPLGAAYIGAAGTTSKAAQKSVPTYGSKIMKELNALQSSNFTKGTQALKTDLVNSVDPSSLGTLRTAMRGTAKEALSKQKLLTSADRAKQISNYTEVFQNAGGGEKGTTAAYEAMRQQFEKANMEGILNKTTQQGVDSLYNVINKVKPGFDSLPANQALKKIIYGGEPPTTSELKSLAEVFDEDLAREIVKKAPEAATLADKLTNTFGAFKSAQSTLDLSAPFRQGLMMITRPKQFFRAIGKMLKASVSENTFQAQQKAIQEMPTHELAKSSGVAFSDLGELATREEQLISNLPEKIPGLGKIARGSNRAYTSFLNNLRAYTFDDLAQKAVKQGATSERNPEFVMKSIAKFVNSATGRGDLGSLETSANHLGQVLFSPRLMKSRFDALNPGYYIKLDPFARKEAVKSLVGLGAVAGSVMGLAKLGGADISTDPRSSDFGKLKFGNTRYDILGGHQQLIVLLSRLASGQSVSSTTGEEYSIAGGAGFNETSRADVISRFFRGKESPIVSLLTELASGKTYFGDPVKTKEQIAASVINRFIPLFLQDVYDAYKEENLSGIGKSAPSLIGIGSQTYSQDVPYTDINPTTGETSIKFRNKPSMGEDIVNALTGKKATDIPKEKWDILLKGRDAQLEIDKRKREAKAKKL